MFSAISLGVLCFFMPKTPPPAKGKQINMGTLLMFDAFKMLGNPPFLVFIICSALICVPLAYYFAYTAVYLPQIGFQAPASTMALGQVSEIFFMLLVPFFFRKFGSGKNELMPSHMDPFHSKPHGFHNFYHFKWLASGIGGR